MLLVFSLRAINTEMWFVYNKSSLKIKMLIISARFMESITVVKIKRKGLFIQVECNGKNQNTFMYLFLVKYIFFFLSAKANDSSVSSSIQKIMTVFLIYLFSYPSL